MSGVVDVGDAVQLTFNSITGAAVELSWLDPDQVSVIDHAPAVENPAGSGQFPYTFLTTRPGMWTAEYTAAGQVERYYVRAVALPALPPLAAVGDVRAQYGTLTVDQEILTSWLLRVASKLVRGRFPNIDTQVTAGKLDPDVVALGVANMVLRVLRNPGGLRSETVGPFSRTYDTGQAAGLVVISDQEAANFTPVVVGAAAAAIGTIFVRPGLAPAPRGVHRDWRW